MRPCPSCSPVHSSTEMLPSNISSSPPCFRAWEAPTPQPQLLPVLREERSPYLCQLAPLSRPGLFLPLTPALPFVLPLPQPVTALLCVLLSSHPHVLPDTAPLFPSVQQSPIPSHSSFLVGPGATVSELGRRELGNKPSEREGSLGAVALAPLMLCPGVCPVAAGAGASAVFAE